MSDRQVGAARRSAPGDARVAPALRLLPKAAPGPLTSFVGREEELALCVGLLDQHRVLTLTGAGGVGKTRVALALADRVGEGFPDGTWFVDLAPLSSGEFVLAQVAEGTGVEEPEHGYTLAEAMARHLAPRRLLLVLDNCEHVAAEAAATVAALLEEAPQLSVLATSREPLGIPGEVTWSLPPLSSADASRLFLERAQQARPDLDLGPETTGPIEEICDRLDRLPLAIELAAARVRALAPGQIASALEEGLFGLLGDGPRTAAPRQVSLRASIEWSYQLLGRAERALFGELSVFAGGFDTDAVTAVCPSGSLATMANLVDRSLVAVIADSGPSWRYRLLETVRSYAREVVAHPVAEVLRDRHRDYYLALAESAEPQLTGPDQEDWLAELAIEADDLRAALSWSRDRAHHEALARLAVALTPYWAERGLWSEWRTWLDAAVVHVDQLSPGWGARVLNRSCFRDIWLGDYASVPALASRALELARVESDEREAAIATGTLGVVLSLAAGAELARPYVEDALATARATGDSWVMALAGTYFSLARLFQSDPEETRLLLDEAIAVSTAAGDRRSLRMANFVAAAAAATQGRLDAAQERLDQLLPDALAADDASAIIGGFLVQGWVHLVRGRPEEALAAVGESVSKSHASEESDVLEGLALAVGGWVKLAGGDPGGAVAILDESAGLIRGDGPRQDSARGRAGGAIPRLAALPVAFRAMAEAALGEFSRSWATLEEAAQIAGAAGFTWILGRVALTRARLLASEDERDKAESAVHEALSHQRQAGDLLGLVDSLEFLAQLASESNPTEALRLWGGAHRQRSELGYERFPAEVSAYQEAVAAARQAAGASAETSWSEGARLDREALLTYATRGRGQRGRPSSGWSSLTPTELEVVRLVAQHLTNPLIAERLFVSRSTVKTHLAHIFAKLGVASRSELAGAALQRGLD